MINFPSRFNEYVFVSNYWPPDNKGGFEVGCMRLANELIAQGHSVKVITSSKVAKSHDAEVFCGLLRYDQSSSLVKRLIVSIVNCLVVAIEVLKSNPRYLVFFGLQNIGYLMLFRCYPKSVTPFVYCSDETYVQWDDICRRLLKNHTVLDRFLSLILGPFGICRKNIINVRAIHTSDYIKLATHKIFSSFRHNVVLHWGVNVDESLIKKDYTKKASISLGGRICSEKGIDIGLKAVLLAVEDHPDVIDTVILLGQIPENPYGAHIHSLIESLRVIGVEVKVKSVRPSDVQRELCESQCFLLPSVWDEPFSIMLLEAMSAWNFCIVTDTGGSSEICKHLTTGYLSSRPNAVDLCRGITWFLQNRAESELIRKQSRSLIETDYSTRQMASKFSDIVESLTS